MKFPSKVILFTETSATLQFTLDGTFASTLEDPEHPDTKARASEVKDRVSSPM